MDAGSHPKLLQIHLAIRGKCPESHTGKLLTVLPPECLAQPGCNSVLFPAGRDREDDIDDYIFDDPGPGNVRAGAATRDGPALGRDSGTELRVVLPSLHISLRNHYDLLSEPHRCDHRFPVSHAHGAADSSWTRF